MARCRFRLRLRSQELSGDGVTSVCVSDPALGGMGDHYTLNADIDFGRGDGTYALDRPQYLVYAPKKNGGRRLAALDYTVAYEEWHSTEPPAFFGIPFTRNDGFGVWVFHIWLFEHISRLADAFSRKKSPLSMLVVWAQGGALTRVRPGDTAVGSRTSPFLLEILTSWKEPEHTDANIA
jgi:hypothetical protein